VAALVHAEDLIHRWRLGRRRSFVVTGHPGEGKTRVAEQMAARYGGQRLDLLAIFANDSDLSASVDIFTPRRCKAFLQSYATGELVLVDELEFLWHRWDDAEKQEFLTILRLWSKPAFFGVFLTPHTIVERFQMVDQDGQPRIFSLHDLQDIE